jgi:hypothetical protein
MGHWHQLAWPYLEKSRHHLIGFLHVTALKHAFIPYYEIKENFVRGFEFAEIFVIKNRFLNDCREPTKQLKAGLILRFFCNPLEQAGFLPNYSFKGMGSSPTVTPRTNYARSL